MDFPLSTPLDEVLLQTRSYPPQKVLFGGERVGEMASYVAGWMAKDGMDVVVLDGANRFDPYKVSFVARKAEMPPEKLLKKIRIARAFTCYQMATLMGEKLALLLGEEAAVERTRKPGVIFLGPITTFLDEDVPEREVRPLFERSLRRMDSLRSFGISFFLFQPFIPLRVRRGYLMERLLQFSDVVWRIRFNVGEPQAILEKGLADVRSQTPHCNPQMTLPERIESWAGPYSPSAGF